jgi:AAHS family 3-hydroxyphenylpropionic acid transporter
LAHATASISCCVLASACEGVDLQAAGLAAAGIGAAFHPTPDQMGTFFSAGTLGLFCGAMVGGWLSDSVGRKRVLVASIALFGLFSLLTAGAWSVPTLILARLLTGLGLGGALPNLLTLVNEYSSDRRRLANVALVFAGMPFGGAVASLVSMGTAAGHWRAIFLLGGVAPLLVAPLMMVLIRESPAFERLRARAAGRGPSAAVPASSIFGGFRAVLADGRAVTTVLLWISFLLCLTTLYLLLNWLPTLLAEGGLSRAQAAGAQIGFNAGGACSALVIGHLLEGRWRRLSVVVTFLALPILMALLATAPARLGTIAAIVFALGCTVLAAQAFLYAVAPACYPAVVRGVGVGVAVAIGRIGSIIGPKLGGMLEAAGHHSSQVLLDILPLVVAASAFAIALACYPLPKTEKSPADGASEVVSLVTE